MNAEAREFPISSLVDRSIEEPDFQDLLDFDQMATFEVNDTPPDHAPPPFTLKDLAEMKEKGEIMHGLYDAKGSMVAYYNFDIKEDEVYVDGIAVHPDYRNRGLGTHLLRLADEEATKRSISKCTLSVDPFNGRGVNAYLKHGYRVTGYKRKYFGDEYPNSDRFWMEKRLDGQVRDGSERMEISVDDVLGMEGILGNGFEGASLVRAADNKKNRIVFIK